MKVCQLHYSEALVRRAVGAFWWRTTGWRFFAAMALVLVSFLSAVWAGERYWCVRVGGGVLGLAVVFVVALYVVHYRRSMTRYRRMQSPEAALELGEESLRVTSDAGSSELAWGTITEVWQFPEFWLLFLGRAQFITFPLADLDDEARELILHHAKSHGAKIA